MNYNISIDKRKKLKSEIKKISIQLKLSLSLLAYSTLLRKINIAVKSRLIAISRKETDELAKETGRL